MDIRLALRSLLIVFLLAAGTPALPALPAWAEEGQTKTAEPPGGSYTDAYTSEYDAAPSENRVPLFSLRNDGASILKSRQRGSLDIADSGEKKTKTAQTEKSISQGSSEKPATAKKQTPKAKEKKQTPKKEAAAKQQPLAAPPAETVKSSKSLDEIIGANSGPDLPESQPAIREEQGIRRDILVSEINKDADLSYAKPSFYDKMGAGNGGAANGFNIEEADIAVPEKEKFPILGGGNFYIWAGVLLLSGVLIVASIIRGRKKKFSSQAINHLPFSGKVKDYNTYYEFKNIIDKEKKRLEEKNLQLDKTIGTIEDKLSSIGVILSGMAARKEKLAAVTAATAAAEDKAGSSYSGGYPKPPDAKFIPVYTLYDRGLALKEISMKTGFSIGEVELILNLRRTNG